MGLPADFVWLVAVADEPRAATISADSALVALMLDRSTYKMILDSKNAVTEQIDQLQQYYQKTTGTGATGVSRDRSVRSRVHFGRTCPVRFVLCTT